MKRRQIIWMLFVVVVGLGGVMYAQNVVFESQIADLQQAVHNLQQGYVPLAANQAAVGVAGSPLK